MKKILSVLFLTAIIAFSCSKNSTDTVKPKTPLEEAIPSQFISTGVTDNSLDVAFSTYKPNADCDKAVFNAALKTIQTSSGVDRVNVKGTNITQSFIRGQNVQPNIVSLTSGSLLDIAVRKDWKWSGYLVITKQNTFLTKDQFIAAVNVKVSAVNTGDVAQILSKTVIGDIMVVEYALTTANQSTSRSISYEVQSTTPVTLRSQLKINCLIPDFISPQADVILDISANLPAVEKKDLGSGVTSYKQQLYPEYVTKTLSEYIALRFFSEKFYPTVK